MLRPIRTAVRMKDLPRLFTRKAWVRRVRENAYAEMRLFSILLSPRSCLATGAKNDMTQMYTNTRERSIRVSRTPTNQSNSDVGIIKFDASRNALAVLYEAESNLICRKVNQGNARVIVLIAV